MRTDPTRALVVLGAIGWMAVQAGFAFGQQSQGQRPSAGQKPQPQQTSTYYDMYEPSVRQRLRRESCARNEEPIGPYCVKDCEKGYRLIAESKPPRCRSIEPLPPGSMPRPVRKEVGIQPPQPGPRQPRKRSDEGPG
jgi:hypothetical protein